MKVRIDFTLDIDEANWSEAFGVEGASAIREDVREDARNQITEHFRSQAFLLNPR
jgi:hypothetical protein